MERLNFSDEPEVVDFGFADIKEAYKPDCAVAYGSGVYKQAGYKDGQRVMRDMIFGVGNVIDFHQRILEERRSDYPAASRGKSADQLAEITHRAAGMFYAPYVDFQNSEGEDLLLKWGVIDRGRLISDLENWDSLYAAGRLHKPVHTFVEDAEVAGAIKENRRSALLAALLMLPENFTEEELYAMISEISYIGDARRNPLLKWDTNKHIQVVGANPGGFRRIYADAIEEQGKNLVRLDGNRFQRNQEREFAEESFKSLPSGIHDRVRPPKRFDDPDNVANSVRKGISKTVFWPSIGQPLKGIHSAGMSGIWKYFVDKMSKRQKQLKA